ncbi:MAG: hypothetical protein ACK5MV_08845 [Aminipila sp.]
MKAIEVARRLSELNSIEEAQKAYLLALKDNNHEDPLIDFEAATYFLATGGDEKIAFSQLVYLFNHKQYQSDVLNIITKFFFVPSLPDLQGQYENNKKALKKYSYFFKEDFIDFVDLKIKFLPFGDGYIPFFTEEEYFGEYIEPTNQIVDRYFFKDLSKPFFEEDLYSQYQLEYLYDTVRKSEWVAKDNHIYLHYSNWEQFCCYMQIIDFTKLLRDEKFVFLIEDEKNLYPIDFKEQFGIDYDTYIFKPIGVAEINKLIWHAQFSAHNGGDFFNEIFDAHPNLLAFPSKMIDSLEAVISKIKQRGRNSSERLNYTLENDTIVKINTGKYLKSIRNVTDKDALVCLGLGIARNLNLIDEKSRIVPAVFIQPHFPNIYYDIDYDKAGRATLNSEQFDEINQKKIINQFKYIKTFVPMRRPTTSYGATLKFKYKNFETDEQKGSVVDNVFAQTVLNCSYKIDTNIRVYKDSRLVRFEDAKLNPKATFKELAQFVDIPYADSMEYCSLYGEVDPESLEGNVIGFSTQAVYRTYDEYVGEDEKYMIEYMMRDAYKQYGYDFMSYDNKELTEEEIKAKISGFNALYDIMGKSFVSLFKKEDEDGNTSEVPEEEQARIHKEYIDKYIEHNCNIAKHLSREYYFINKKGQPLKMMKKIDLDKNLLENEMYK